MACNGCRPEGGDKAQRDVGNMPFWLGDMGPTEDPVSSLTDLWKRMKERGGMTNGLGGYCLLPIRGVGSQQGRKLCSAGIWPGPSNQLRKKNCEGGTRVSRV